MKTIRVILLILIIVGIVAICTQKIWVPKLVDKIIGSGNIVSTEKTVDVSQKNITLVDGRQCYSYNHEATKEEPSTVNELMDITIAGSKVVGIKKGTQNGPELTNGYEGKLDGTLDKDTIKVVYSYVVEGSKGKEEEIYKTGKSGIDKLRYQLVLKKGILVPDFTKSFSLLHYSRVPCVGSN